MDTVPDIFAELGGVTAIANETGIPLTTVHSWKRARFVPRWRVQALVLMAKKLGKEITEASFPVERPGNNGNLASSAHGDADTAAPQQASPGNDDPFSPRVQHG